MFLPTFSSVRFCCAFGLLAVAGAAPGFGQPSRAAATAGACQPVFDGLDQVMSVPTHVSTTLKMGNDEPRQIEAIYAGGAIYQKEKAGWEKKPFGTLEAANQERQFRKEHKPTCKFVKEERVDGQLMNVYEAVTKTPLDTSTAQVWVMRNGRIAKQEIAVDGGKSGSMHYSVKYSYDGVEAPKM